jgi:CRP-like cAMP-binding protein/Zn-dependent protease
MSSPEARPGIWGSIATAPPAAERGAPNGLWRELAARFDPAEFRPKLAEDIEIKEFKLRWGNDYAMIAQPRDLVHYRLTPDELQTVRLMDGTRTVKEIVLERFRESGDLELEGVAELVRELQVGGFLDPPFVDTKEALRRAMDPSVSRAKVREFTRTFSVEWKDADRLFRWMHDHGLRFFFNRWVALLGLLVGIAGVLAFISIVRSGQFSLGGRSLALEFLILGTLNYFITFTHETGHALGIIHYGRRIKSAGFMIYYGSPAWFIEASDSLMLDIRPRVIQSLAGPLAEIMIAGVASIVAWAVPDAAISTTLYKFAVLNYFVIFMNLVPLLELDGYYVLSDLIQVPDLRPRSLAFIRYDMWHKLRVRERFSRQEVGLAAYGIIGVAFAVFSLYASFFFWRHLFGNLIIQMWEGGLFTRTLLIVLALVIAGPLLRGLADLARTLYGRGRAQWQQLVFRFQKSWRIEAAELIDDLPMFQDIPVDVLNDLAGRIRLRSFARGQAVIRQGGRAEAFYVVRRGTVQVVEEDPESGDEQVLRTMGRGESFGELGLLESQPRAATVRAAEEVELFEIDKGTFDQLLADMATVPEFAPTLEAVAELRSLPSFQHLEPAELTELLELGEWANFPPGRTVIEQGQVGDSFYAIWSGQVEVIQDGSTVKTLGPGSYFGEIALLLDVPRTASIRTITPVRAYRLDREGFDRLVSDAFRTGTLNPHVAVGRTGVH